MSGFTQTQIDALTVAIAAGQTAIEIEYEGRRVKKQYGSLTEMIKLRDRMIREVNAQGDAVPRLLARSSVFARG